MGCDIHVHVEIRVNNTWHHYQSGRLDRNYKLFAKMADVRNDFGIDAIAPDRGLPKDVTFVTQFDCDRWGEDGHSHSWMSSTEVAILEEWLSNDPDIQEWKYDDMSYQLGWLFGNSYESFHEYREDYPSELQDFRWVFWFDN